MFRSLALPLTIGLLSLAGCKPSDSALNRSTAATLTAAPASTGSSSAGGPINPNGLAEKVSLAKTGDSSEYRFTGLAGQSISVATSGSFADNCSVKLSLIDADGYPIGEPACAGHSASLPETVLKADGLYKLQLRSTAAESGTLSLKLGSARGPQSITPGAAALAVAPAPGQTLRLGFVGTPDWRVAARSLRKLLGSADACVYVVRLIGPDGSILSESSCAAGNAALAAKAVKIGGVYQLEIQNISTLGGSTAPVPVQLFQFRDQTGAMSLGARARDGMTAKATLEQPGQRSLMTFSGRAGERYRVLASESKIATPAGLPSDRAGIDCDETRLSVLRPDGSVLTSNRYCGGAGFIKPFTLDQGGDWTLMAESTNGATGSASLSMTPVDDGAATDTVLGTIPTNGSPVTATISSVGGSADFTFAGIAGRRFSLFPTDANFPNSSNNNNYSRAFLVRPDGSVRNSVDCYDSATCLLDPFDGNTSSATALDVNGTWTVSLHSFYEDSTGSAQLRLYTVTDQTGSIASNGTAVTSTISTPGQRSIFTFAGTAGQRYSAVTSASTLVNSHIVYFRKPDGSLIYLLQGYNSTLGYANAEGELLLDQTGDWAVVLDPAQRDTGSTSLQLYQVTDQTGSIATNGTATTVNLTTPGQNASLTFTGTVGQRASVAIINVVFGNCATFYNNFNVRLVRPDGSVQSTQPTYYCNDSYLDFGVLDQSGTFTLVFDPQGVATGSASVQLYAATDQTGTIATSGTAVTSTITTPGQRSRFTFSGTAGQRYSALLSNAAFGPNGTLFSLLRPDGTLLTQGYANPSVGAFLDTRSLDQTGTWTVVVDPQAQDTGTGSVQLYLVTDQTAAIATNGTAVTASITTPGQNSRLTFAGTAGQRLSSMLNNSTFTGSNCGNFYFLKPDGSRYADQGFCSGVFKDITILDQTGTWTIAVDPNDQGTGTASVQLYLVTDQTGSIATNGTAVTSTITTPGQNSRFTFSGTAGQRYSALISNPSFSGNTCSNSYFLRPDGTQINAQGVCSSNLFKEPYALDQTGTWTFVVDAYDGTGTASLRLNLITDQSAAITAGGAAVGSNITVAGQRSLLSFTGAVGDNVTVTVRDAVFSAMGSGALNLVRPDGSILVYSGYSHTGTGVVSGSLDSIVLDQAGSWSIVLDPTAEQTATASVRLVRNATGQSPTTTPERAAVGPINPNGTAVSVNVTTADQRADYSFTGTAGQRFGVLLSNPAFTGNFGYIYLRRPDGQLIPLSSEESGPYFQSTTSFFNPYTLDQSGTWRVVLQPSGTGTASLSLIAVSDQTGSIATTGTPVTSTITTRGQASRFSFTGTPGQLQSLQGSGSTSCAASCLINVLRPDGSSIASGTLYNGNVGFVDQFRIDQAGTYTVVFDPYGSGTGTASLRLYTATDQTAAINSNGTAVNVNITVPGQNGSFSFTGTAGQRYSVQATNSNFGTFGAGLYLRSPDGRLVFGQYVYDGPQGAFIDSVSLDQSGSWSVFFDALEGRTGTASVQLFLAADQTGSAPSNGTTVNANVTVPGQQAVFSFTGTAGQRYAVNISNAVFGPNGAQVYLQRPDGSQVGNVGVGNGSAFLEPVLFDQTGGWKLVLDPSFNETGSATLQLLLITDQTVPIASNGTALTATITTPGQRSIFTFTGSVGQRYSARISNSTLATCCSNLASVLFRRPDGSFVNAQGFFDPGVFVDPENGNYVLDQSGSWALVLDPGGASTGSATVQVYLASAATGTPASDGTPFNTTIPVPGQNGRYTFTATAGQRYDLQITGSTFNYDYDPNDSSGCYASYSLLRPDNGVYSGQGFAINSNNTCQPGSAYRNVALDTDGTWTVLLNPSGMSTGSAQLSVTLKGSPVPTYWADFTSATPGTPGSAAGSIGAPIPVTFTYSGEVGDQSNIVGGFAPWTPVSTYFGGTIQDPPLIQDGIALIGGGTASNTVTFSKPVRNPVLAISGLGYYSNLTSYQFAGQPFTVQSGGPSTSFGGNTILSSGSSVIGTVGNGTVQFNGTFSSISWTNPTANNNFSSSGFTVGIPLQPPPAPTGTTATPASTQVTVAWTAAQTAATYNVYRGTTANDPSPVLAASGVTGTTTVITGLTNDTLYYFSVAGVNAGGTGARSTEASATPGPSIRVNDVTLTEGNSGTQTATFTVTLSRAATSTVTVAYATANGTATAGSDYVAASGSLSFTAGQLTKTVAVTVNGDTAVEPNETFFINLTAPTNATIADNQGLGTINNDDLPSLSINDVSVAEGNSGTSSATFTVSLSTAAVAPVTVNYLTADGTATAGSDYLATSGTASFAVGQSTQTFTVTVNGDTTVEPNETFFVNLSAPTAATIADAQGVATITNDDSGTSTPSLSINDVSTTEGNAGTKTLAFTVSLSPAATGPVTVAYATANGTATAGSDYVAANGTLTFPTGTTTQTVNVTLNGDTTVEPDETLFVNLSAPSGATIADAQGQGTIVNDDATATPTLAISDVSVTEGNSGTVSAAFTVSLSAAASGPVTVAYATADGTATAGSDYVAGSGTLTFATGTTTQTVNVVVNGDTAVEPNETFFVNLTAPSGATVADAQGQGTIVNDDAAATPTLTINDVSIAEGNTGTKNLVFTVSLSPAATGTVAVTAITANGTATSGSDYTGGTLSVSFTAGQISKTISLPIKGDTTVEPDETFFVNLSNPTGGAVIGDAQGIGTILNDDGVVTPSLSISDVSVTEGNAGTVNAAFTVSLSAAASGPVTVAYATADGTATAGSDYVAGNGTLSFAAGTTTQTVNVLVNGDTVVEPNETFFVNLSAASGATIADSQGIGTVVNDDAAATPTLAISDVSVTEGNSGTVNAAFTVSLSAAASGPVTVAYATADGTATAGSDYVAGSGTLTFAVGATTQTVNVLINGDTAVEPNETFFVNLSSPTAATIADAQGQGSIVNDDVSATPSLSISDVSVTEGNSGTVNAAFTVSLSAAASSPVTVAYATADGTATAGSDYVASNGTLTFAAGTTTQTVNVLVNGDTAVEPNETFVVNLSAPTGATIADVQGQATISNDDTAAATPTLTINDVSITEGNTGTKNLVFTVSLMPAATGTVTVSAATANGTATSGTDYTGGTLSVSFTAGQTAKTISLPVKGDTTVEPDETFFVNLSNPTGGAVIGDTQGIGTILNDDGAVTPSLSINDVSVTEGNSGTVSAAFTVSLSAAASGPVTVAYATADGTATAGSDYVAGSGTLTFATGTTTQTVNVVVNGDTAIEPNETFFVNLSSPTAAAIADAQGQATISNDDSATPTLSINDVSTAEGNSGTKNLTFTVSLSSAATGAVSVAYATADGTAAAGSDYLVGGGTLSFPAGTTTQTVNVVINGDTAVEPDETFFVNLSSATGATIADAQGLGTISNDDAAATPTLTINDVSTTEGNSGTKNLTFTVSLSPAATGTVAVTATTANGTATSGSDYTGGTLSVSFTAGQTSKTISLPVKGDATVEPDETFFVNLTNPTGGAVIGDAQGLGTILNDD
ncbi:Calx-beta domain-containing protein [Nevskia ramosa]|uniref:Calx-beta domain-containing protein n=1 Tax=Nevskia ramosa TaxID=64002 RepID=UPI003D100ABC